MENQPIIDIKEAEFVPAAIAQRCPVCNGFGTLKYGAKTCQACDGKGYVLVPTQSIQKAPPVNYDAQPGG